MKQKLTFKRVALILIFFLIQNPVFSASGAPVNSTIDPGVINEINRDELKYQRLKDSVKRGGDSNDIKEAVVQKTYENGKGMVINPSIGLNKVTFAGNTIFKEKELEKYFSHLLGKDIYLSDIFAAIDEINKMYYTNGYYTSYAYIPAQRIENNSIVINIVEGKIGEINIEGNTRSKDSYIKNCFLCANGIEEGKVFNSNDIRKTMDTINSKSYIQGRISVDEGKTPNTSDIKLELAERYPLGFNVTWDNGGNRLVGRQRSIMLLSQDNLFGLGHSIYGGSVLSKGTTGALAGYKMPIGKHGTELQFDYSFARVNLLDEYAANDIKGKAQTFSTRIVQPLYKTANTDFKTDLGIDFVGANSMEYATNTQLSNYKLTVLRHGLNLLKYDNSGLFLSRFESSFGLPILGATESTGSYFNNDTTNAQSVFFKIKLDLTRLQQLPKDCYGIFRISSQYTPNNLFPAEQMYFGGVGSIRGFEPGSVLGDIGINGTLEVRTPVPYLRLLLPKKLEKYDKKVRLGFFYDWGIFRQQNSGVAMQTSSNLLQSVGSGIHFNVTDSVIASFEVGIPVSGSLYREQSARFHFSIRADLWDLFTKKPKIQQQL
ncbi:MAG TPA: ShlB/FhaC/HecB family hemolysin secretion/activation protein [Candidatus Gastranaerophilaceae bacterium]|nr:ShlB/FhaC/HecB family hemolysin secretion/activation protein [Candidatus Gastranaerophilaceae bacterium]HPT40821.1 ShlB/FhaC/HecB family hemolysin secretion/activation protein [Candidatus Gastranaerophilaceae bacterium]